MFPLWLVGCLISLGGSLGAIVGTNIQKLSFRKNQALPVASRRIYYRQTWWLCGLILVAIGGCTDFVALGLAPQSTIAALGSISLAANVFLAHFWLGETISLRDGIGTILIVVGSTLSVVWGDHSDATYKAHELQEFYTHKLYIIYGSIICLSLILMYLLVQWRLTPLRLQVIEAIDSLTTLQLEYNLIQAVEQQQQQEEEEEAKCEEAQFQQQHQQQQQNPTQHPMNGTSLSDSHPGSISHSLSPPPLLTNLPSHKRGLSQEQLISVAAASVLGDEALASNALLPNDDKRTSDNPISDSMVNDLRYPLLGGVDEQSDALPSSSSSSAPHRVDSAHSILVGDDSPLVSLDYPDALDRARLKVCHLETMYTPWSKVHPVFYCAISGIFGAQSLLFGKSVATLFATTMSDDGSNQFTDPLSYIFMLALVICLIGQLHFFAAALQLFDAMFVVPVFKCFFLTLSTVGGALYFQEFTAFDLTQCIIFPSGLVVNLIGVYVLCSRDMNVHHNDSNEIVTNSSNNNLSKLEQSLNSENGLEDIEIDTCPESEANTTRLLADATERLLKEAAEVATEESAAAAAGSASRAVSSSSDESAAHADQQQQQHVLLVTSPIDGVVLVAAPTLRHGSYGSTLEYDRSPRPSLSPKPISRTTTATSESHNVAHLPPPLRSTSAHHGGAIGGESITSNEPWISPPQPSASSVHELPSELDLGSSVYPNAHHAYPPSIGSHHRGGGSSLFSPIGHSSNGGMEVSVVSLPTNEFLRNIISNNNNNSHHHPYPYSSSQPPYPPSRSVTCSPRLDTLRTTASSPGYGSLRRITSEQPSSMLLGGGGDGGSMTPGPDGRSRIHHHMRSSTLSRLPPGPRSSAGSLRKPSDILVQCGTHIYRRSGGGERSATPLDSSIEVGSSTIPNQPSDVHTSLGDSIAMFLAPGSASSFTVQSPLTHTEYSMPRKASIFPHTRAYLQRLSAAANRSHLSPSPMSGRGSSHGSASPAGGHRGYTAPSPRTRDHPLPTTSIAQQQHAFSDIVPHTFALTSQHGTSSIDGHPFGHNFDVVDHPWHSSSSTSFGVPADPNQPVTPASTYIPSGILAQPLALQQQDGSKQTTSNNDNES